MQGPLVLEAGHKNDKECSKRSGAQGEVEEEEEDGVQQEVSTSSGRDQMGPASQGVRGGFPAGGCLESCCRIKPHTVILMLHAICTAGVALAYTGRG